MGSLFAELKRRQMFRVAAAYAVLAWLLLQIVNNVAPVLDLPPWVARAFLLALIVGFPVALFFAWMRELAPSDVTGARSATSKLDYALIGALVLVIALVSYQQLAPASREATPDRSAQPGAIAIAVLPFANLSGDASQKFFSDGMTEEINAALAKVQGLTVLGRGSVFQFEEQNRDPRVIGRALNATHLIEGSVRKAGDRVRINAQLVRADNAAQLWSETYDRQLTDIFVVQEDIAQAIAGALRVPLELAQGENLVSGRSIDPESYEQFLRAKALVRSRGSLEPGPLSEAAGLLESVVARDSDYAPAWALQAQAYAYIALYSRVLTTTGSSEELRRVVDASFPKAEAAAQRAVQLDPNSSDGYMSLAVVQQFRGEFALAETSYTKALALDPNNPDALNQFSYHLAEVARLKEAVAMRQKLQALEPFVPVFNGAMAEFLWLDGQIDAAIEMYKAQPLRQGFGLARAYAAAGRYSEAADALGALPSEGLLPGERDEAVRLLRTAPAATASAQLLPRLGRLDFVYLHVGAPERTLEYGERAVEAGLYGVGIRLFWHPSYAPVRKTERFKVLLRKTGVVDYWREKGWPDLCRPATPERASAKAGPVGADDFVCD